MPNTKTEAVRVPVQYTAVLIIYIGIQLERSLLHLASTLYIHDDEERQFE